MMETGASGQERQCQGRQFGIAQSECERGTVPAVSQDPLSFFASGRKPFPCKKQVLHEDVETPL